MVTGYIPFTQGPVAGTTSLKNGPLLLLRGILHQAANHVDTIDPIYFTLEQKLGAHTTPLGLTGPSKSD